MKWVVMLVLLFSCVGCATDGDAWEPFWRDLRGDNMKMSDELPRGK